MYRSQLCRDGSEIDCESICFRCINGGFPKGQLKGAVEKKVSLCNSGNTAEDVVELDFLLE